MKIQMTKTAMGATDGHTVLEYKAGQVYDVGESARALDMAGIFIKAGLAAEISDAAEADLRKKEEQAKADKAKAKAAELKAKVKASEAAKVEKAKALLAKQGSSPTVIVPAPPPSNVPGPVKPSQK